ncbi:alpha-soluble NSF attachment protein [Tribolium castaneum]|uniref:Soluble NSF attachment protein-like Protein n=1 Tax=Tribolium castaneum TaxID=7070 RepID=D7ELK8_TRICA|nr:PREDICTED: alpha-soluble NSF attachment protein [Tribolium castaneum]EFA12234.1 Soluble NSF attachment protein-like Protein [Tribolium castaneum]|eukprot:XP_967946.1 PREDICTED: alpha-soluble NSF attachment protein [Tribolium castaneum]
MTNAEERARQLVSEAEKKLSPKGFFQSLFFSSRNRTEDAIECYQKAGSLFKLAKNWLQASTAFRMAGDLNLEQNNRSEAANDFVFAAKCLDKYDTNGAVKYLLKAIQIYTDLGRFITAAKLHNNIGEIYEQNLELENAIQHYEQAADYYKVEDNFMSAKKCLLKVAEYASSEFHDYNKAVNIFQEVAFFDLKTPILHYNVKDNLCKAGLCHLCVDSLNAKLALESYLEKYPDFENTAQFEFLKKLIECVEEADEETFNKMVADYDKLHRLDTWHTKVLLKIRKQIKGHPNLL